MIPKPPWRCWHDLGRTPLHQAARLTIATLALTIPAPVAAQGQLDTLRIDSLMSVAADRVQSAAIAAAREDADVVLDARTDLFGYGGVFGDVLGDLAAADCEQARHWVNNMAEELFWLSSSLTLAAERSADGEMDQWPNGPEVILDELEALQETWAGIKDENRELCNRRGRARFTGLASRAPRHLHDRRSIKGCPLVSRHPRTRRDGRARA